MIKPINPSTIAPPFGPYSQAVQAPAAGRWLHVAGQVGAAPDGAVPAAFEDQARVAWDNLVAILAAADMSVSDLIKVTTFIVDTDDLPKLGPVRAGYLKDARPASTLVVVKALARPEWKVEVEAIAFRAE